MRAVFVELPAFDRHRSAYLDEEAFRRLQEELLRNFDAGDVIAGAGGLRIIYFWWEVGCEVWFFALYDKDEVEDLSPKQKRILKGMLEAELEARR